MQVRLRQPELPRHNRALVAARLRDVPRAWPTHRSASPPAHRRPFSSGCAQAAYAEAAGKKDPHAHITAYKATRKAFPEPKGHHFGAIPGIAPGQELLSKAHAAAINVHRAIYKGISVRKEKGAWSPVESISISGGYLDDEDGGETICARMPFVQASRPQPPPFL